MIGDLRNAPAQTAIRILVWFSPGSPPDIVALMLDDKFAMAWGKSAWSRASPAAASNDRGTGSIPVAPHHLISDLAP